MSHNGFKKEDSEDSRARSKSQLNEETKLQRENSKHTHKHHKPKIQDDPKEKKSNQQQENDINFIVIFCIIVLVS